jgi:hypothetical protein
MATIHEFVPHTRHKADDDFLLRSEGVELR